MIKGKNLAALLCGSNMQEMKPFLSYWAFYLTE
jgi:hypothetical protein